MAVNIFLNRVKKREFKAIHKAIIFLIYRKRPLSNDIIDFITNLAKFYHLNDQELEELFFVDTRYNLNIEDTIIELSKQANKMLLFFLTIYAEIFDEIDLDDIYKEYELLKKLPISKQMQKNITTHTKEYIDKTVIMHHYIYNKKVPFILSIANAMDIIDLSKEKDKHFFIIDREKIDKLSKEERVLFILTLKELMLDDNTISPLEEEALKLWSFYLNLNYAKVQKRAYAIASKKSIDKLWVKNFLLFSYLITQNDYKKSLKNAKAVLDITNKEAKRLIDNVTKYAGCVKSIFDLVFSSQLTYQNETKAQNMNYTLHLGELALFAVPQTKIFKALKTINILRRSVGTPLELSQKSEIGITKLKKGDKDKLLIVIDGFLTEGDKEQFSDWIASVKKLYPNYQIKGFKWRSHSLKTIVNNGLATWYKAVHQTLEAGKMLSKFIIDQKELNPNIQIKLMGHSLGARVIFNTLYQLLDKKTKVDDIFLFGGAVSNDKTNWSDVAHAVSGNIYNFYSKNDDVLKNLYQLSMFEKPIGLHKISLYKTKEIKGVNVKNFNVSDIVGGHRKYKPKLKKILQTTVL